MEAKHIHAIKITHKKKLDRQQITKHSGRKHKTDNRSQGTRDGNIRLNTQLLTEVDP